MESPAVGSRIWWKWKSSKESALNDSIVAESRVNIIGVKTGRHWTARLTWLTLDDIEIVHEEAEDGKANSV